MQLKITEEFDSFLISATDSLGLGEQVTLLQVSSEGLFQHEILICPGLDLQEWIC